MTAALVLAAAMSVFTDDFATNQTLAEHWQADGEIRSEGGRLVIAPGAKATWRGSVPEKYVLTWVEGEERRARRRQHVEEMLERRKAEIERDRKVRALEHKRAKEVLKEDKKAWDENLKELKAEYDAEGGR